MKMNNPGKHTNEHSQDSVSSDSSEFSKYILETYSNNAPVQYSLNELADCLIDILKRNKEGMQLYKDIEPDLRDVAGVLVESGEVDIFRNNENRICIRYHRPGLIERVFAR
jgi:hypothetical protein